jgi:hypothetical protein
VGAELAAGADELAADCDACVGDTVEPVGVAVAVEAGVE